MEADIMKTFEQFSPHGINPDLRSMGINAPSSTWTYLINDNPFEKILSIQLAGNIGLQVSAGILGPLMSLYYIWRKLSLKPNKK